MSTSLKIQKPKFIDELEQVDDLYEEITLAEKIQNKIIESFQNQNDLKIVIHPLNKLLIIKYNESLDSHDF